MSEVNENGLAWVSPDFPVIESKIIFSWVCPDCPTDTGSTYYCDYDTFLAADNLVDCSVCEKSFILKEPWR